MKATQIALENHIFALFQRDCNGIRLNISEVDEVLKVGYEVAVDGGTNDEVSQRMQDFARARRV